MRLLEEHNHDGVNTKKLDYNRLLNIVASVNFKVGHTSRELGDGTGDQAITGIGFEPKCVIIFACSDANGGCGWSVGFASGTAAEEQAHMKRYTSGGSMLMLSGDTYCVNVTDDDGDYSRGKITSFDSDGFTINWDNLDETVDFSYLCIG